MVERRLHKAHVAGSIPAPAILKILNISEFFIFFKNHIHYPN